MIYNLDPYIVGGENKYLEFKEKYSKTLLKTVSAFSNYHTGQIIVGISDYGDIIGCSPSQEQRLSIENAINDSIIPRPDYEIEVVEYKGVEILVITVYKGELTPYTLDNKTFRRMDTSTVPVSRNEYKELILHGKNITFEDMPYEGELRFSKLTDLLINQLDVSIVDDNVLKSLGLIDNGKYNNAAGLLADKNCFEESGYDMVVFKDIALTEIVDSIRLKSCSIIEQFDTAMLFYAKHINKGELIKNAYRISLEDVPEVAYREAVANSIIHRDYLKNSKNRIEIHPDRIEIVSIGGLPIGMTESDFKAGTYSNCRNKICADIFYRCKMIEKMGTGIRRIKRAYSKYNVKPEFIAYEGSVVVVLPRILESLHVKEEHEVFLTPEEEKLLHFIKISDGVMRSQVEEYMNVKKTKATTLLNSLLNNRLIIKFGNTRNTKYKAK